MRAVEQSLAAAERYKEPSTSGHVDALLLAAASGSGQTAGARFHLLVLCAIVRKMSTQQRVSLMQLLVQSFADATHYVPLDARRILVASELPPVLECVAERIQVNSQTWLAWTDNRRTWFVVADIAANGDQGGNAAAIRLRFYDEDGECAATGTWVLGAHGTWKLDSVGDVEVPAIVVMGLG
jgi:hypothetical protein